jgi:hypothetical protein
MLNLKQKYIYCIQLLYIFCNSLPCNKNKLIHSWSYTFPNILTKFNQSISLQRELNKPTTAQNTTEKDTIWTYTEPEENNTDIDI